MCLEPGLEAAPMPDGERLRAEAAELRAVWDELDIAGVIDVHTHFMPENVLEKVWAYFDRIGPFLGRDWPVTYRFAETERLSILHHFGVLAFPALVYAHKPNMAAWLSDWALDFAAETPGCLPTATFHPEPGVERQVIHALDRGAAVFKCHVQVGDFDPNDPLLEPVWATFAERGTPIVIHAGSGPAPGRFTGPDRIASLLRRHPDLALVIAHMGMPEYREFLDLAEAHPKVHLDTTMAFTPFIEADHPFPADQRSRLVELGDRILFGSDFPNIPYRYVDAVRAIVDLDLGDRGLRGVFHDNALRLGLAAPERPSRPTPATEPEHARPPKQRERGG